MTMIVGYAPDERGKGVLHLAALLAHSSGEDLVVVSVIPTPWVPGMARIDAEYRTYLDQTAAEALQRAQETMPDGVPVTYEPHSSRSAATGLLEKAEEHGASLIVLGSSSDGSFGHIALGSVSDRLVHSSPVSLALATRGFRCREESRVVRATAAYGGSQDADDLVVAAATVAARTGARLRVASFAVWERPSYVMRLGTEPEDAVLQEWITTMDDAVGKARATVSELEHAPPTETVVGRGRSWAESIDDIGWAEGDVLVVGSSALGPVAQVFLGSRASKILRHSPVPVVVVPRSRVEALARA